MRNTTLALVAWLLALTAVPAMAQSVDEYSIDNRQAIALFEQAMQEYRTNRNDRAKTKLISAVRTEPKFVEAHILLGNVYMRDEDYERAERSFKNAINLKDERYVNTKLFLAQAQLGQEDYDNCLVTLEAYLQEDGVPPKAVEKAKDLQGKAQFRSEAIKNPVPFEPVNLGPGVNSANDEYLPAITADGKTLVITRRERQAGRGFAEDFYVSSYQDDQWEKAINLGAPINTAGNEGAQCVSPDGRTLYFTGCNRRDGYGECDIYVATKQGNDWSKPKNLGAPINTSAWESQPSISPDGKTLYFASSRKGGKGGLDIWRSVRDENGKWGEPESMDFNSKRDDISPCMHPDNQTLYFASEGHPGMGGLDLFVVRRPLGGEFGDPKNLGYPINTQTDDACLIVSADGELAYFSSNREDSQGGLDLYAFKIHEEAKPNAVNVVQGKVYDADTKEPLGARFKLYDLETGELVASSVSDKTTGRFMVTLPPGKGYALSAKRIGYAFFSENFDMSSDKKGDLPELDVPLQPIKSEVTFELKNIFFETAKYDLDVRSRIELDQLHDFLKQNASVNIFIEGHTDNVGSDASNQTLSENRAKAVYQYLIDKGSDAKRMKFEGYGAAHPRSSNDTAEGRADNRRIEVRIQ